jgi:hypothetical protein
VNGEERVNGLLQGKRLERLKFDRMTAHFHLLFDGNMRLDVFNNSSGYEGWQAMFHASGD